MKKTFLTFALAGLATAAFAHTSFYKTDAFDAYVDGQLHLDYANGSNKVTDKTTVTAPVNGENYTFVSNDDSNTKLTDSFVRLRLGTGLDFKNADGLTAGYYVRLQTVGETLTVKDRDSKEKETLKPYKFGKYVNVHRAYAYLGHKDFGTLTVGSKLDSVVDYGFDYGLNTLTETPNTVLRNLGLDGASDPTVKYDSANYNGFQFAYSFSNNNKAGHGRQNSFYAQYDFGGTVLSATAAFQKSFANEGFASSSVSSKTNAFEVALQNTSLVEGLYLGLAYDYAKVNTYSNLAKASQKTYNQVSAKAAYTVNQYFTPYLVLGHTTTKVQNSAYKNTKQFDVALGAQSEVYKLDSLSVKVFAEGFYSKQSRKFNNVSKDLTSEGLAGVVGNASNNHKNVTKGFALGAAVNF